MIKKVIKISGIIGLFIVVGMILTTSIISIKADVIPWIYTHYIESDVIVGDSVNTRTAVITETLLVGDNVRVYNNLTIDTSLIIGAGININKIYIDIGTNTLRFITHANRDTFLCNRI